MKQKKNKNLGSNAKEVREVRSEKVRRNSLFRRTFNLLDTHIFQKIFLRGVLGGFDHVVRLMLVAGDFEWPNEALETQQKIFREIAVRNRGTSFGKKYNIRSIETYEEFRDRVPTFSYEEIFPYIERMLHGEKNVLTREAVVEYAKSSGTSNGRSKYIPTPNEYMQNNHLKGGYDMVSFYARMHPHTNIFSGKAIAITGSYASIPESAFKAGDISALMVNAAPWWTAGARSYKKSLALLPSWPQKANGIVEKTLDANIVLLGGTPTWMIEILEMAQKKSGVETLRELWPNLEVFFHGAVAFAPYRKTCENLIGKRSFEFREVYNASEGFFAFEDEPVKHPGEMLLCTDHDIFYEFIPVEEGTPSGLAIPLSGVKIDVPYALVITTGGGLWRYIIGDIIVFKSTKPYRLKILGRITQFLNAFGEEVVADNALRAIAEAAQVSGSEVTAFTVAPTFDAKPAQGTHEWIIEFRTLPIDVAVFEKTLDEALRRLNSDYDAKRTENIILGKPIMHFAPAGVFHKYMESKGKLGGQHKVTLLSSDRKILEEILSLF